MQRMIEAVNELGKPTLLDWAPIGLSTLAIIVAVLIPSIIAKKQNKIAVFDKLFDAYSHLLMTKSFAEAIKDYVFTSDPLEVQRLRALAFVHFEAAFGYKPDLDSYEESIGKALASLRNNETKVHMISLLIAKSKNEMKSCATAINAIYEPLFLFVTALVMFDLRNPDNINVNLKDFIQAINAFFVSYSETIEDELLTSRV